jgi:site-specific DNA recombinase
MRAGIYYRVSSEEQVDGFSLDAQRRILLDHCAAKGWTVADEYADEGKSARTDRIERRPAFKRMIEDAEAGRLDVVVVHKIDRFARNIRVTFECLELLARHRVTFVAVAQPDLDYTRPEGRLFMGMMATLAQYYSDNLAQETKKGMAERKAQGLYNGRIPWGMAKGDGGLPVADPATIDGLRLAFRLAAEGESDRDVAQALNAVGYRTHGYRTGRPELFSKDTVARMLQNRFYLGELPGERPPDATPARHGSVIDGALFAAAQAAREQRATSGRTTLPRNARVYSLSGLGVCAHCGGKMHIQPAQGRPRVYCSQRRQRIGCTAKSGPLDGYEGQIAAFLATFAIPADYRERLRAYVASEERPDTTTAQRKGIEARLSRIKELYSWGDIERGTYLVERETLARELAVLDARERSDGVNLDRLAELLTNVGELWAAGTQDQRNRLARLLFAEVVIEDTRVVRVRPHAELAGFFTLNAAAQGHDIEHADSSPVTSAR